MGAYDQRRIHQKVLGRRAMVYGKGRQDMYGGIFRYQKYKLGFLEAHLRPKLEINGIKSG
jgi:hypothetical protein